MDPLERRRLFSGVPSVLAPTSVPAGPRVAVDAKGDVFGTLLSSSGNAGTVYEVVAGTSAAVTIASFGTADSPSNVDGIDPRDIVIDAAGNLFGDTASGGVQADGSPNPAGQGGTIWELPAGSSIIRVLATFGQTGTDAYNPAFGVASLAMDASGDLFASVGALETSPSGTAPYAVEYEAATGKVHLVARYTNSDQNILLGNLTSDAAGNAYALYAVPGGGGQLVKFSAADIAANAIPVGVTIASFDGTAATGSDSPQGVAVDAAGDLFVTTAAVSSATSDQGRGGVAEVAAGTAAVRVLATPDAATQGSGFYGNPVLDRGGDLFAVTSTGGPNGYGSLAELPAGGSQLRVLLPFTSASEYRQVAGLATDEAGDLIGTMPSGTGSAVFEFPAATLPASGSPLLPTVQRSTLPATALTTQAEHGTVTIRLDNSGGTAIAGMSTVSVYAVNAQTGIAGEPIGSIARRIAIKGGRSATLAVPVRKTLLPVGTYSLVVRVTDSLGRTSSGSLFDPLTVAAPQVALTATLTSLAAQSVKPGQSLNLTLSLAATGNVNAAGRGMIAVHLSADGTSAGTLVATVVRPLNVKPGARPIVLRLRVKVPSGASAGTFYPVAVVTLGGADPVTAVARTAVIIA